MSTELAALEPLIGPPYAFPEAIEKLGPGEVNRELTWAQLTDEQKKFQAAKMSVHAAMIDRMDQEIGRVLAQLKSMGQFDNTLVLFLSDNGASAEIMVRGDGHDPSVPVGSAGSFVCLGPGWSKAANTPFRRHKTWVHEGGISTPLIAHWPRGVKAKGQLHNRPGHVVDIAPTLLELAGGSWPTASGDTKIPVPSGESFASALRGSNDAARRAPLWWLHEGNRALRDGQVESCGGQVRRLAAIRSVQRSRRIQRLVPRASRDSRAVDFGMEQDDSSIHRTGWREPKNSQRETDAEEQEGQGQFVRSPNRFAPIDPKMKTK